MKTSGERVRLAWRDRKGEGLVRMPGAGDEIGRLGTALEEASALLQAREAAVREAEERTRSIIEATTDAFIEMDAHGSITGWNRAAETTFDWSRDEAVGRLVSETIIAPRYREAYERGLGRSMATGGGPTPGERIELGALHRDGHEFPVELTVSVLRFGASTSFTVFVHDITERKRTEEEIRAYTEQVADLYNRAPYGYHSLDPDGLYLEINDTELQWLGYTRDEVVGRKRIIDVLTPSGRQVFASNWGLFQEQGFVRDLEVDMLRKDGTTLPTLASTVAVRDQAGALVQTRSTVLDMTEYRKALTQLEEHGRLFDRVNDAIVGTDTDGRIVSWNRAAEVMYGWPAREALGMPSLEVLPSEVGEVSVEGIARELDATGQWRGEARQRRRDGTSIDVEISRIHTTDANGGPGGSLSVVRDVTERKRVEEAIRQAKDEAERANRAKSEFLSRMSHELRTPLNAILGFGQLLEMEALPPEQQDSVIQILKAGRHLLDLINEVLDISGIEAGSLTLSLEPVRIADALRDALDLIRPLADARSIEISIDNRVGGHHIRADRQRLKQVLLNLLSNAVKYNAEGGHVTLSCTEAEDGLIRIGIADTGSGIPPEEMERVFSPFDRLGRQEGDVEGTGLGLALSKGLMEAMGGRLDVESVPGEGSTFTIELPLAESPRALLEADPAETVGTHAPLGGQHTLLYIEDNLSNLKLIERLLERRPQVRLLSSMQAMPGIELARQYLPELILLDLNLPDIGGEEALRRLRADPLTREIPVIIVSADATPSRARRLLDAGASDYLTKPLDMARFLEVIDDILGARKGRA